MCRALAEEGYCVIRFDYRDIGQSSKIDFEVNPYALDDLARDTLAFFNARPMHIVGLSMGGYVAQLLAAYYPELIKSLTLISTSPDHRPAMAAMNRDETKIYQLPPPLQEAIAYWNQKQEILSETDQRVAFMKIMRLYTGERGFNKQEIAGLMHKLSKHASFPEEGVINHRKAIMLSPERTKLLKAIAAPTLIIHGDKDIIFPVEHAAVMAQLISYAKLEIVHDMGHCISDYFVDQLFWLMGSFLRAL